MRTDKEWQKMGYSAPPGKDGFWPHGTAYKVPLAHPQHTRYWDGARAQWVTERPNALLVQGWMFDD